VSLSDEVKKRLRACVRRRDPVPALPIDIRAALAHIDALEKRNAELLNENACVICSERIAHIAKLQAVVENAIELAAEGWTYASPYFREKWEYERRIDEIRKAVTGNG
jgi:hypothetical protein